MNPEKALAEIAAAEGDFKLSLHRVLKGFIQQMAGPENFGKEMALIAQDAECNMSSRVSVMNNMSKLLGQCAVEDEPKEAFTEAEIEAAIKSLDADQT